MCQTTKKPGKCQTQVIVLASTLSLRLIFNADALSISKINNLSLEKPYLRADSEIYVPNL
jgi:hypothetical protein